jgi:hypothetical protein
MMVAVARSTGDACTGHAVQLIPQPSAGPRPSLAYDAHVGSGVHVSVDLMSPGRWHAMSLPGVTDATGPLVEALIGEGAADRIRAGRRRGFTVDPSSAAPWVRIAFVDALDRWLQAPLEQSLVDAERGVSRGCAARTLPPGQARALLVGDALQLARRASHGVVTFLRRLARRSDPIPNGLVLACARLVDGYEDLRGEVAGPDRELTAVIRTWRRLSSRLEEAGRKASRAPCPEATPWALPLADRPAHRTSMIDPRQVSARVFALAADPAAAEVEMRVPDRAAEGSVVVRAPAFGPAVDPDIRSRLLVRLVERRSATPRGHALLGPSGPHFEATVPLCGLRASDVRADVFDALSDTPPAATDDDRGLGEARRAVVFLAEWRRLAALAHLPSAVAEPARRLRELAARLQPLGGAAGDPTFGGGPSAADLNDLAELGDARLLRRLRGSGGSARLLVAEIAAAHREPGAPR